MNQYIITEEMLEHAEWLRSHYPGKAKEWDDFMADVRSRLYNPQVEPTHFIIPVGLRANVVETLRMAGCPCLAEQVLEETMSDIGIQADRDKVLEQLKKLREDIIDNNLNWEEISGTLEDIEEELRTGAKEIK